MNKKFIKFSMFGALLLASTGAFVACTDYDDDIKGLQEQIDANKKSIDAIQALLNSGQWVKSVTSNANGVTITMGDGKTFDITNGSDGIAGQAGSVITMGENGNWLIDGVDSGKSWKGEKGQQGNNGTNGTDGKDGADGANGANGTNGTDGKDGATPHVGANGNWFIGTTDTGVKAQGTNGANGTNGSNGTNGTNGTNGKDGAYYVPNTDGFWYKYEIVDGKLVTSKGERWRVEDAVTAVYDEKDNMIVVTYGTDKNGKAQTVSFPISHTVALQSMAFVPEVMQDGLGVVDFYTIVKNSKVVSSSNPTVLYRLNPTNASVKDVKSWSFLNRAVEMRTRATGDAADLISTVGEPVYPGNGTVEFKLAAKKLPTAGKADLFALKATETINNETFDIVSDYAQVANTQLKDFVIADTIQTKATAQFVDFSKTLNEVKAVEAYLNGNIAKPNPLVHSFVYTESIDLKDLVGTYTTSIDPGKYLADLGFSNVTYTFTAEKNYFISETDQQKFVTLNGSKVTVNKEWLAQGTAAIGRTPIFKVEAKVAGTVIATAYIKIRIAEVKEDSKDKDPLELAVKCGDIQYTAIDGKTQYKLGWDVVNQKVYDKLGLTNTTFFEKYGQPILPTVTGITGDCNNASSSETGSTFAWIILDDKVELGEGKYVITYPSKNKKVYPDVQISFSYNVVHPACKLALNPDYMIGGKDIIAVKGRLEVTAYEMISGMNEHFKDYLKNFVAPNNHKAYAFRLKPNTPTYTNATGVKITTVGGENTTSFKDQEIMLTAPMTAPTKDVDVQLVITLENGEQEIQDYVVRFINPFVVSVDEAKLKTLTSQADTKELSGLVTIKDTQNKLLYNKNGWTADANAIYKLTAGSGVTFVYNLVYNTTGDDTEASFGGRLTLQSDGTLTWDNKGADLQRSKSATSKVTVTIPKLATIVANGKITVLSTELSK